MKRPGSTVAAVPVACVCMAGILAYMVAGDLRSARQGATPALSRLATRELVLLTAQGAPSAALVTSPEGPLLVLYDQAHTPRAQLLVGTKGAALAFFDAQGRHAGSLVERGGRMTRLDPEPR